MTIAEANEPFASGMRILIERKGLKGVYVADQAGCTPQELSDMLCGRRLIKACDIPRLAEALDTGANEIYVAGMEGGQV